MATNAQITIPAKTWTLLNSGGAIAGAVTVVAIGNPIWVAPTTSATPPTTEPLLTPGAFQIPTTPGGILGQAMGSIWPGIAGAHIYAYSELGGRAAVSCA